MTNPYAVLDDVRIASPCSAKWDAMSGSETVRFCGECKLNVYNLSEMKAADAAALIERTEGRMCIRLYRRTDGTTITRDCPVGLRARVRRASRAAGAFLATLFGLAMLPVTHAQEATEMGDVAPEQHEPIKMGKMVMVRERDVTVTVVDESGNAVDDAVVTLTSLGTGDAIQADSSADPGAFVIPEVEPGVYTLTVEADGYDVSLPKTLRVKAGQPIRITVKLHGRPRPLMGGVMVTRSSRR